MLTVAKSSFYKSGGTLSPDEPSYVERRADGELHERLCNGQFCYVLTSRQMGKSSLMSNVSARLQREGIVVADIDLTTIGQNLTVDQWYDGLIYQIGRCVNMKAELRDFWQANAGLGPLQRFITTLRDGLLAKLTQPVIIFVDEIEVVRSLRFSTDEFFAAIRECYNRRGSDPEMRRLTFCLLGMATPQDLIQDPRITPFNIGKRIELTDFTFDEARPLSAGMAEGGRDGVKLLRRVLYWTSGQPYLTQRFCQAIAEDLSVDNDLAVDRLCRSLFLSTHARESEPNLVPMREFVLRSAPDRAAMLDIYKRVLAGRAVTSDPADENIVVLQLAGITCAPRGRLLIRNRIYRHVFNRAWISANTPDAERRRLRAAFLRAFALNATVFGSIALLAVFGWVTALQAKRHTSNLLYVTDMQLADQALSAHNVDQVRNILKAHIGDEMAGFEYGYLWRMCDTSYRTIKGTGTFVTGVSFSPDSRFLACARIDGTVQIVDIDSGAIVHSLQSDHTPYAAAAFSPAGEYLATISRNKIDLWSTRTWRLLRTVTPAANTTFVSDIAFDPQGHRLAAATTTNQAVVYDTSTWKSTDFGTPGGMMNILRFSPDGNRLATAGTDGEVRLWNISTGKLAAVLSGYSASIHALAFSPDGKQLAVGGEDDKIMIWDARSGHPQPTIFTTGESVYALAYVPSVGDLAIAGSHNAVEFWNPQTRDVDLNLDGHSFSIHALAYSPNGQWLATGSWDGTAKIWGIDQEKPVRIPSRSNGHNTYSLSRDGRYVAGLLGGNDIGIWDAANGMRVDSLHFDWNVSAISLAPNRNAIAIADGRHIEILEWPSHRVLWKVDLPVEAVNPVSVALSPDGNSLAVGGLSGDLEIWGSQGRFMRRLADNRSNLPVVSLAFSDDGDMLAAGSQGAAVDVYSLRSSAGPVQLLGHHSDVTAVAFSPDGRELVSGSADSSLKIWNLETLREVMTITTKENYPSSIAFRDGARAIEMVGHRGTLYFWESASAADVAAALKNPSF